MGTLVEVLAYVAMIADIIPMNLSAVTLAGTFTRVTVFTHDSVEGDGNPVSSGSVSGWQDFWRVCVECSIVDVEAESNCAGEANIF